jgi:antitoxin component of RelBE/YafQ-DinJ toxin-antitoxin module
MKTTIQVPVEKSFKIRAENYATKLGYSSLQEYIRVSLTQSINKKINPFSNTFPPEYITPEQEAILDKKWAKSQKEIKKGNFIKSSNVDELMAYLNRG